MKVTVDKELCASERGGQFVLMPDILLCAGKHRLGVRAVAAQFSGQSERRGRCRRARNPFYLCFRERRMASRARSLIRIVSSLCALLRGVEGWK